MAKRIRGLLMVLALVLLVLATAFMVSPRPSAWLIRVVFDRGAEAAATALQPHLPIGITAIRDQVFDADDKDARLDVFHPAAALPSGAVTVVWVHGGGWVSGDKNDIAPYAQVLAAQGFTVVTVNYSLAPGAVHPQPARQVNRALAWLQQAGNAERLHINPQRLVLAGDSAGAQIAAQVANLTRVPAYAQALGITPALHAEQLAGMLLYCGAYDLEAIRLDGPFGLFLRSVLWSYSGRRDFMQAPGFRLMSMQQQVTGDFPPTFISAGNADPLAGQSKALADTLEKKGVRVERLFFAADYQPPLPHEYQFNLDGEAGRLALQQSAAFLASLQLSTTREKPLE